MKLFVIGAIALLTGCETLRSGLHEEAVQIAKEAVEEAIQEHCEQDARKERENATNERRVPPVDDHHHEVIL